MASSVNRQGGDSGRPRKGRGDSLEDECYRALFDQAGDAIFVHDMGRRILEVNETACEMLGYSREQLLKMELPEITLPEHAEHIASRMKQLERQGRITVEAVHRTSGGELIPVEISARCIQYEGAQAVLSTARDISGRKQNEQRLRNQGEMLRAVIDNIPVMITWYDQDIKQFRINQEFTRKLGWTARDAEKQNALERCLPDPEYREQAMKYMKEASMKWRDFLLKGKDGSDHLSAWSNVALSDGNQIAIGIDMSDRLQNELAIETLVESTSGRSGEELFNKIVEKLCDWLEVDAALLAVIEDGSRLKVVSSFSDGKIGEGGYLDLEKEPCRDAIEKGFMHIERDVHKLYPQEETLNAGKSQGYVSIALRDKNGKTVGVMAASSRRELILPPRAEKILSVIAARIGAELDRLQAEQALVEESAMNRAMADLSRYLIRTDEISEISRLLQEYALNLTGSKICQMGYTEGVTGRMVCPDAILDEEQKLDQEQREYLARHCDKLWDWVKQHKKTLLINDTFSDEFFQWNSQDRRRTGRLVCVPAIIGFRLMGMVVVTGSSRDYSERDISVLERLVALLGIMIQRHEDHLELSKLSLAVEQSPNSIAITDPDGVIEYVNERFCTNTGYSRRECIGVGAGFAKSGKTPRKVYRELWRTVRQGRIWQGELLNRRKDGVLVWELVSIAPLCDVAGRITHLIESKQDLGLHKEAEKVLENARRELEQRVGERTLSLERANEKLQEEIERRKLSEQAVSEQRDRAQHYLDLAGVMFLTLDEQGSVTMINRMGCEILGWPEDKIIGSNWFENYLPESARERIRVFHKDFVNGIRPNESFGENEVFCSDGSLKRIAWHNTVLRDGQGNAVGSLSSGVDITESKRMERALEQERLKLQMMLSHESLISTVAARFNSTDPFEKNLDELLPLFGQTAALDSVVVWQLDQPNGRAGIYSRWESARGVRCALAREFCRDDLPDFYDGLVKGHALAAGPGRIESELFRYFKFSKDCALLIFPLSFGGKVKGAIRYSRANGMDWSDEEVSMFGAVSEIITNAWERESEFQARLAAERSNTDSVQMVERATRLASIGVIAAGITHEINQPLNAIRLTSDGTMMWIERNGIDLPLKIVDRLSKISSHVERITRIIRHMREFWASSEQQESGVFDLSNAVEDALGLVEQQLKSHGIKLRRNYFSEPVTVAGDRMHVEQIAINLIVNAMQSLDGVRDEKKRLEISTRVEEKYCILEVADNGPGFQGRDREKMFDLFYSTKKPGEGTGLGLAIVKRYAEELGGTVEAESISGGAGALFRIRIPFVEFQEQA